MRCIITITAYGIYAFRTSSEINTAKNGIVKSGIETVIL